MLIWAMIIIISSAIGVITANCIKSFYTGYIAALIPWLLFLVILLISSYFFTPDPFWPIAQLVGGTVAAFCGFMACKITEYLQSNKSIKNSTI